jgi:hypothetical protein
MKDKFQHQRGHTLVPDTAILLPPMGKGGSDWSTDIVEPFTWFHRYSIFIMKTMFKPDFSLSDILPITRHVKDWPDLSPLWAPSDFSLEKREENATANIIIQKKTF